MWRGFASPLSADDKADARRLIVKVAPLYPREAQMRGIEGYCQLEFTVTPSGHTRDIEPVYCSPPGYFEKAAVSAVKRFKYLPVAADGGAAISPERLQYNFDFKLDR